VHCSMNIASAKESLHHPELGGREKHCCRTRRICG
jgi:hypothetical protein